MTMKIHLMLLHLNEVVVFQAAQGESRRQLQDCDVGHHQPNTATHRGDSQYTQISFTHAITATQYLYHRLAGYSASLVPSLGFLVSS